MELKHTALFKLHEELGAKLVPFAAYSMPVSYPEGIIQEHLHTRSQAGLFDVSHMGQLIISGEGTTAALEKLMPVDLETLEPGRQTYALFTNEQGGVMDDLMISKLGNEKYLLVVNAACKENDIRHLQNNLPEQQIEYLEDRGLLALQGPAAKKVLADFVEGLERNWLLCNSVKPVLPWMEEKVPGCYINRCGYTGRRMGLKFQCRQKIVKHWPDCFYSIIHQSSLWVWVPEIPCAWKPDSVSMVMN